jgi:hypothetical protein
MVIKGKLQNVVSFLAKQTLITGTLIDSQCSTTSDSPDKNATCIFPWKFNGILRQECITDTDPDDRYWCSTKVDDDLEHYGGKRNWGFCSPKSCPPLNSIGTFSIII